MHVTGALDDFTRNARCRIDERAALRPISRVSLGRVRTESRHSRVRTGEMTGVGVHRPIGALERLDPSGTCRYAPSD